MGAPDVLAQSQGDLVWSSPGTTVAVDEGGEATGLEVTLSAPGAVPDAVRLSGRGLERVRVLDGAAPLALPADLPGRRLPLRLRLVGLGRSAEAGDVVLVAEPVTGGAPAELALTVVELRFLGADGARLDPARASLHVSNAVTDDEGLPREAGFETTASDPDVFRIEVVDPTPGAASLELESVEVARGLARDRIAALEVRRAGGGGVAARSAFVRLVADDMDRGVPGLQGQLLKVALGDRVRARWRGASVELPVGRSGAGRQAEILHGRFDVVVLRLETGGRPVVGMDDGEALAIARRQVQIANEVYAQCGVTWGEPGLTRVRIVDPPRATLLAVSDGDGLSALGGEIRLRVAGRAIRPLVVRAGSRPIHTAVAIAERIRALGLVAIATENARTDPGAQPSADVVARGRDGEPLAFETDGAAPLTTDGRQTLTIGTVDLTDLLDDFDNMTASSGTLEERTLWKTLADGDPETIDMFLVNRFASGGRQGEAFIEGDASSVVNAVLLDRSGLRQERESWTQAHEAGHVVLDQAFHPDNAGPDRPWLLMDADASLGAVTGPKRFGEDECARMRAESGPDALPSLLQREARP